VPRRGADGEDERVVPDGPAAVEVDAVAVAVDRDDATVDDLGEELAGQRSQRAHPVPERVERLGDRERPRRGTLLRGDDRDPHLRTAVLA